MRSSYASGRYVGRGEDSWGQAPMPVFLSVLFFAMSSFYQEILLRVFAASEDNPIFSFALVRIALFSLAMGILVALILDLLPMRLSIKRMIGSLVLMVRALIVFAAYASYAITGSYFGGAGDAAEGSFGDSPIGSLLKLVLFLILALLPLLIYRITRGRVLSKRGLDGQYRIMMATLILACQMTGYLMSILPADGALYTTDFTVYEAIPNYGVTNSMRLALQYTLFGHPGEDEDSKEPPPKDTASQPPESEAPATTGPENSPEPEATPTPDPNTDASKIPAATLTGSGLVPECPAVDGTWFDDAVFVGDSVSLRLNYYESAVDKLGGAQFLTAGSLGSGNALWPVSDKSVHPTYQGEKMLLEDSVAQCGAKKLYIMLGMNDLSVYGVDGTAENLTTLLKNIQAKTPDLTVFVQTMTPMTATSNILGTRLNNDVIREYNKKLEEVCNTNGWYLVDVASVMYAEDGTLRADYCSDPEDMGVHFTNTGCEAWIQYLLTHVPQSPAQDGSTLAPGN